MKTWQIAVGGLIVAGGVACAIVLPITLSNKSSSENVSAKDLDDLGEEMQVKLDASYATYEAECITLGLDSIISKDHTYLSKDGSLSSTSGAKIYVYSLNNDYWNEYKSENANLSKITESNLYGEFYIYYSSNN